MTSDIWTEKYRPKNFDEVVGQDGIIKRIKALTNSLNIPHLLFAGPAGTGKSTLALIVVKELFGENWRENYLELNASDERGINIVREKVKNFARTKSLGNVSFKVIFLDEADALTPEAQQALRRTMENYAQTCRFIMSCNYSSKLIDPIQSRCSSFRFKLLEKKDVKKVLERISKEEKIEIDDDAIEAIYEGSDGDCRRSVNFLQSTAAVSPKISKNLVKTIISEIKPKDIRVVLDYALSGDFENAREKLLNLMLKESLSGQDIIKSMQKEIWNLSIEPEIKVKLTEKTGEVEFRIVEGSDPFIQLQALVASFVLAGLGK
ncbi:Replication factor C small subunit [Candidatus Pacearchaeota archaeon CG1_02_30_18]|nr:replication factor C small subunit [Candidatus Pacearchaeota archaeon]OIO41379.1 MAG: Replication factor C small subunit [Candidatus Pacearchaeota archaeon CG1_02_30_18]PIN71050.1 MAG: replication factor C small subunit [Candidatus Pacearchaeota archaeon CG11_big_fil_rev_8_21_14_0_20_30_13]PIZ82335.1 MAG: replication factor C small subunit [Candidatus Pacearchaeota archaeon CG_4_10_14_0_2_um_filter_30_11]